MNLRQLKYFIAVAEELHFGRAAERLHVSQPPITRQVQSLEESLGTKLFNRTPRGVELTQSGALFLEEARNIADLLEQAADRVRRASEGGLGRIDVAIFGSGVLGIIPRIVLDFKQRYPGVKVVMHTLDKRAQIAGLQNRSIDLGFNRMLTPTPGIVVEELTREPLFAAVADPGPLAGRESLALGELAGEPLLLFPAGPAQGFVQKVTGMCHEAGFAPNIAQIVGDALTSIALVAAGFGVSLIPQSSTQVSMPGVRYIPLAGDGPCPSVDLSCLYREGDTSPILNNFLDIARSASS